MGQNKPATWTDVTAYSQGERDKVPRTWELRVAGVRIVVTRHIYVRADQWVVTCEPWFNAMPIEETDIEVAKRIAEDLVRSRLVEAAALLPTARPAVADDVIEIPRFLRSGRD